MAEKPVLLAYLNGMPDFESTYPVLARLHKRGRVTVRALVYSKLLRKEVRLRGVFDKEGFAPEPASKLRMKLLYQRNIREADAVLTIADPYWDTTTRKQRGTYMAKIGQQSIFLQHGAYQVGVNARKIEGPMEYYSQQILFWEPLGDNRALFTPETAGRVEVVGFTKQNILPGNRWGEEVSDWVARYPKRLLVCQSFRWGQGRYTKDHIGHFYDLMDKALSRHPDLGIIIRSHRGKVRSNHRAHDRDLARKHPNVMFSHYYGGPLAKATIHDAIDLAHGMISPTSTTVLDCIYSGKPAAVFAENLPLFAELPQIGDLQGLEAFVDSLKTPGPVYDHIRSRFGDLDGNLDRAAEAIERRLLTRKSQS
ncbi:hypothetical protein OEZ71_08720 [Defluviimonas sp. WL0050]|uniref:Uncharacterized protein n=1 Tax=Albidovulum litorale TaxID=2984134 RepID=A0ABT2ZML6_9RHOB|nr:hypothetical protein [Defluviimonas sp. WL0050]MCV2872376.1 hypothetical protein [Defluviimonas sp. WL0050]